MTRLMAAIAMGVAFHGDHASAQATTIVADPAAPDSTPALEDPAIEKTWSFYASASLYLVPDSREYIQPTLTADRGWLHLEARYNYEGLDTGSAWIGYNFSLGEKLSLELTPMLGGVFGDTCGVAPGFKGTLGWWKLELYTEAEYVVDAGDSSGSYFYSWTELSMSPVDSFRFGLVIQRTRLYQADLDIQRGFLIGFSYGHVDLTTWVFNPDKSQVTVVLGVGITF